MESQGGAALRFETVAVTYATPVVYMQKAQLQGCNLTRCLGTTFYAV